MYRLYKAMDIKTAEHTAINDTSKRMDFKDIVLEKARQHRVTWGTIYIQGWLKISYNDLNENNGIQRPAHSYAVIP